MRRLVLLLLSISAARATEPSFSKDVYPIFESNCLGCHSKTAKMGGLELESYASMMKGGAKGVEIVPGKSDQSRLYLMVAHKTTPAMPLSGKELAGGEIDIIRNWIDAGAKSDGPVTARRAAIPDIKPTRAVQAQIGALAYRPDGKLLALGTFQEVRLIDPISKTVFPTLTGHAEQVRAVAFSADGKLLAAAGGLPGQKGEVKIWDVDQRKDVLTITGHSDCIYAVAFAPDGKSVATSSYDKLVKLWDIASGKEIRTFKDHIDAVYALAFSPDGTRLASASADRSVKIWDVATAERLYTLSDSLDGLNTVAIDPTGKFVAAGGLDKTIRVWSLGPKSGELVHSLIAHEDAILKLAYSPDGKILVSTAADKTIKTFKAADLTEIKDYPKQSDWVLAVQFAPDGKKFAAGRYDGSLAFFETQ